MIHSNNNKGVYLFNTGDYHGAMQAFQCGVDILFARQLQVPYDFGSRVVPSGHCTPSIINPHGNGSKLTTMPDQASSEIEERSCATTTNALPEISRFLDPHVNEHRILFVYNRLLVLQQQDEWPSSPLCYLSYNAVLLFNFGLVCHHCGMLTGSETLLRRAKQLYSMTLSILHGSGTHNALLGLIHCLTLNNLAHLHYENCEYQSSRACLECLDATERLFGWLSICSVSSDLSESEYVEILRNVACIVQPHTARAA